MSDRAVAELCGVTHPFVMGIRAQVVSVTTSTPEPTHRQGKGKDGKSYPVKASKPAPNL